MRINKYRILLVTSHPVQYSAPVFRRMAQHPRLDILVAYCSLKGVQVGYDPGFSIKVSWDIPLLDGYPWVHLTSTRVNYRSAFSREYVYQELWKLIRTGDFDAVIVFTGYHRSAFWISMIASKIQGTPFLFGTDSHKMAQREHVSWKLWLKRWLLPIVFTLADTVLVTSTGGIHFVRSLGVKEDLIHLTPYTVDNDWWIAQAAQVDRSLVRQQWNIPLAASVLLFCAKLQPWKRPIDVLYAFAKTNLTQSYLVFAGEGPQRAELEATAQKLNIFDRVRFLGFVNQSQLPAVYSSADLLVLPSEYEPFGVVVNEAMLCGCPVIVSDQVGAHHDLVQDGETGYVVPVRDVEALSKVIGNLLVDPMKLAEMRASAAKRMQTWAPQDNISSLLEALDKVLRKDGERSD